jgi:hypothetical protein
MDKHLHALSFDSTNGWFWSLMLTEFPKQLILQVGISLKSGNYVALITPLPTVHWSIEYIQSISPANSGQGDFSPVICRIRLLSHTLASGHVRNAPISAL